MKFVSIYSKIVSVLHIMLSTNIKVSVYLLHEHLSNIFHKKEPRDILTMATELDLILLFLALQKYVKITERFKVIRFSNLRSQARLNIRTDVALSSLQSIKNHKSTHQNIINASTFIIHYN